MAFTTGEPKRKRGFLLVAEEPAKETAPSKEGEMPEDDEVEADEPTDEANFEALADKAGVEDPEAFMEFLKAALKRCHE